MRALVLTGLIGVAAVVTWDVLVHGMNEVLSATPD